MKRAPPTATATATATTPAKLRRGDVLALVFALAWAGGALLASRVGMWHGVGAVALLLGVAALALDGRRLAALLRPRAVQLAIGVVAGALMAGATYVLYPPVARALPGIATETERLYSAFGALSPSLSALALAPVILGEELVWRGIVQDALTRRFGTAAGVVVAATLYAVAHAPVGSMLLVATALACGLVWGALRAVTGNLVATLVSHLLWDTLVLLLVPLARPPG
ncbi:MAG: hypothetical protein JWN44_594 [Myxococcales bacterium]|nr:hypothetical protein [Myxococcales bacterium]